MALPAGTGRLATIGNIGGQASLRSESHRPFERADLVHGATRRLTAGRWANAVVWLHGHDGADWVVKDFRPRSWLVRNLIGRFLVRRELGGLRRLRGVPGTPQDAFRVDAFALAYRFVPGRSLRGLPAAELPAGFFPTLERNVHAMHARAGIVHLDMRNADNILVTPSGEPSIIDFQSQLGLRWIPGPLRRLAERVDHASVYKHWAKRSPETLGTERRELLDRINELRPLWALRGYFGAPRSRHRRSRPDTANRPEEPTVLDSIHRLFNNPSLRKVLVKSRVLLGALVVAAIVWNMDPRWLLPGFLVSMFGEVIQLWCFASLDKGRTLAFNGPYAFVRNPMYLGRYFILLGGIMLLGRWWMLALFTVVYYFYMVNRVKREEEYLRGPLGAPYEDYLRTVNRFLPGTPKPGSRIAFWDWKLLKRNHGTTNLVATLAFWAIAWAWAKYGIAG